MNYIELNRGLLSKENYVLKAAFEGNYWFGLEESKIVELKNNYGDKFSIIIFGGSREGDFYVIPFSLLSKALTKETLSDSESRKGGLAI